MRDELIAMAERDVSMRSELASDGSLFEGYHPRMRALHDAHALRLAAILEFYGWPGEPEVGADGARAAWLLVQHAIGHPKLQRMALQAMQQSAARGHLPALFPAMLEDRVRTLEGRPQRYGTQYDWDSEGRLSPSPLEDESNVDQRRAGLGLPPLHDELARRREAAAAEGERPPAEWAARQAAMERWLREVGWR